MMHVLHIAAVAAVSLTATSYLLLLLAAGGTFLYFLYAPGETQDRWNKLNETDPEEDFTHQGFEIRGY